jgi:hypothetical protein
MVIDVVLVRKVKVAVVQAVDVVRVSNRGMAARFAMLVRVGGVWLTALHPMLDGFCVAK